VIDVEDEGEGFDPTAVPDPTASENLDIPSGRGLMLIRSFMADVTVHPPGNRITMRYRRG
jgi:serine/threonine-protein kinase RsbW